MKNYIASIVLLLSTMVSLSSCRETSKLPEPANESVPLIIPVITPGKSSFNFTNSRYSDNQAAAAGITRSVFEFVVNPSQGYSEIQTVEVYKSIRRGGSLGPRVLVTNLTSFPATITMDSQQALEGLFLTTRTNALPSPIAVKGTTPSAPNRILAADAVVFTFEYVMKDGRRVVVSPVSTVEGLIGAPLATSTVLAPYAAVANFTN